jgi:hypothetical protein
MEMKELEKLMEELAHEEKIKYKEYDPQIEIDVENVGFMNPNVKYLDEETKLILKDLQQKFEEFKELISEWKKQELIDQSKKRTVIQEEEEDVNEYQVEEEEKEVLEKKLNFENSFQGSTGENLFYQFWLPEEDVNYQPKKLGLVQHDFFAQDALELSVSVGEEVKVSYDREDGWTFCSIGLKSGLIPTEFYKEIKKEKKNKTAKIDKLVRGKVIIQHTLFEHGGRYMDFVKSLLKNGFAVFSMDLVGHGKSEGNRGFVGNYANWSTDFSKFYDIVQQTIEGDTFIFGQGIGGPIAYSFLSSHTSSLKLKQMEPSGIILSGATFDFSDEFKSKMKDSIEKKRSSSIPIPCSLNVDSMVISGESNWN